MFPFSSRIRILLFSDSEKTLFNVFSTDMSKKRKNSLAKVLSSVLPNEFATFIVDLFRSQRFGLVYITDCL